MNIIQQAMQQYAKGSNSRVAVAFIIADGIGALLTFLYVHFFGRHQQENFLLSYLAPLLLLVLAAALFFAGTRAKRGWEDLIYVVLALFVFSAAVTSFAVTFVLLKFVY